MNTLSYLFREFLNSQNQSFVLYLTSVRNEVTLVQPEYEDPIRTQIQAKEAELLRFDNLINNKNARWFAAEREAAGMRVSAS